MKKILLTGVLLMVVLSGFAQKSKQNRQNPYGEKPYKVLFYNFENLFDTIRDPEIYDSEFTPEGGKRWNTAKYTKKIKNLERVLFDISATDKIYPAVIGIAEIENRSVLEDVISQPKLRPANYRIVHYDSPDRRGVDVAFFYRPDQFKLEGSSTIGYYLESKPDFRTRDILTMWGTIEGEPFYFMVAHWPSRLGGKGPSAGMRRHAADLMRAAADSVMQANPATKVVMMGDFNDDATDASVVEGLRAKGDISKVKEGDMFNPFIALLNDGIGTLAYRDSWNLFDNIVVSENVAKASEGKLKIQKANRKTKYYGSIFTRPYMLVKEGQFKGYPLRTFVGNNFQGGFSDHFPVYIYIGK